MVLSHTNNKDNMMMLIKGKRTKRARPLSPSLALTMSTSTTDEGSSAASEEFAAAAANSTTSEEEEDMAHCLILLAQGSNQISNNNKASIVTTTCNGTTSSYECKTCNRSFNSFQALGGHRASHKKPKLNILLPEPKKSSLVFSLLKDNDYSPNQQSNDQFNEDTIALSLQIANSSSSNNHTTTINNSSVTKVKVHECGICGAEFSSGQALGGHMRRHRPIGTSSSTINLPSPSTTTVRLAAPPRETTTATTTTATRSLLSLDLNLPASPEDEQHHHRDSSSKFVFSSNDKTLVFTASSLVDCHY